MGSANYINQLITKSKEHINNNTVIVGTLTLPHWNGQITQAKDEQGNKGLKWHTGPDGHHR